jgi:E3 ubiquitin-protein ligase mind-bomb
MKKCVRCRLQIEEIVPRIVCQGGKPPKRRSLSKAGLLSSSGGDVTMLQQELHHLKEKTLCMVCMDRRKNCVFLCGHGTCQLCADKLGECPICRKPLKKKIILFD